MLIACRIVHSQHLGRVFEDPRVAGSMPAAAARVAEALLSQGRVTVQRHDSPNPRLQSHPLVRSALVSNGRKDADNDTGLIIRLITTLTVEASLLLL